MVQTQREAAPVVPLLCDGKWITPRTETYTDVYNPSTEEVIGRTPMCGAPEVDAEAGSASRAFESEVFGPVLAMMRPRSLEEAIGWMKRNGYGNGATIFTRSGAAARQFTREMPCGMIGINIGVPAPMALFSFSGWNASFYGDLHVQGMEGVLFYTRQKVVLSRWGDLL